MPCSTEPPDWTKVPPYLVNAFKAGDVPLLLRFWEREVWPLPDEGIDEHPLWPSVAYAAMALDFIGMWLCTDEQRKATVLREKQALRA